MFLWQVLGLIALVPFPDQAGDVSGRFHRLGQREFPLLESTAVTDVQGSVSHTSTNWVTAGQQPGAGRRTHIAAGVKLCEAHTCRSQCINVGRFESSGAVSTQITQAQVVSHYQYDIRPGIRTVLRLGR